MTIIDLPTGAVHDVPTVPIPGLVETSYVHRESYTENRQVMRMLAARLANRER
jgi:hypothetical protein